MDFNEYQNLLNSIGTNENPTIYNDDNLILQVSGKSVIMPIGLKNVIIRGDSNSKVITFEKLQRYANGHDLSEKDIKITFSRPDGQEGQVTGTNIIVDEENNEFSFDWTIGSTVSELVGTVYFTIEITSKDESGDVTFRWQTTISSLEVEQSISADSTIEEPKYIYEIYFYNNSDNSLVFDDIVATNTPIKVIDRDIVMPSMKNIIVEQDTNSKSINFTIDRYFDGMDLSTKAIAIPFRNAGNEADRSLASNVEIKDNSISFNWMIDGKVTKYSGRVSFAFEFLGYTNNGKWYAWHTKPAYISVEEGLDADGFIEEPNPSWIQSWNVMADSYLKYYMQYLGDLQNQYKEVNEKYKEIIKLEGSASAAATSAKNQALIAWNQADRTENLATQVRGDKTSFDLDYTEFNALYNQFYDDYNNVRKKDEVITLDDLSSAIKLVIENARLKTVAITEDDISASLMDLIGNGGGTGTGGGSTIGLINDSLVSYSKTYSSARINQLIIDAVSGLSSGGGSDNNYTTAEKIKLSRIEDNANYFVHPLFHLATIIQQTPTHRFVSDVQIEKFLDKYTKSEIDNLLSALVTGMIPQSSVASVADIATTYPNPKQGWSVETDDTGYTYTYNGSDWIVTSKNNVPLATDNSAGLMTPEDKAKLDSLFNYEPPTTQPMSTMTETADKKILTANERQAIANIENTISTALQDYRSTDDKIIANDLDSDFLDSLRASSGGNQTVYQMSDYEALADKTGMFYVMEIDD